MAAAAEGREGGEGERRQQQRRQRPPALCPHTLAQRPRPARGPHAPPPPPQRLPRPPGPRCRRVPSRRRRRPPRSSSSSAAALGPPPPRAAIGRGRRVSRAHWFSATPVNLAATSCAGPALLRFPSAAAAAVRARRGRGLAARAVTCPAPVTWWRRPPGNGGEKGGKREGKGEKRAAASAWREPGRAPGAGMGLPSRHCVMAAAPFPPSSRSVGSALWRSVRVWGTGPCVIN